MAVRKKRIVALDDSAIIVRMLEVLLGSNYEFRGFTKADRALAFLGVQEADLLILDIDMPEINGFEVYDAISKISSDGELPYIAFLTGKDEMVFDALKKHPLTFIRKSDYKEETLYCLKKIIDKTEMKDYVFESLNIK